MLRRPRLLGIKDLEEEVDGAVCGEFLDEGIF